MSYLLDVNTLVALAHEGHANHRKAIRWFASRMGSGCRMWTCSITEIGFVRVSLQAGLEDTVPDAIATLDGLKSSSPIPFQLLPDAMGADRLPAHVITAKQVTDGHLLALAREASLELVTLDEGIPGALLIQ